MRLRNVIATLPALAVGMALWKHSLWVVGPENDGDDGTCAGLEAMLSQLLAVASFMLAAFLLFKFNLLCRLARGFVKVVDANSEPCQPAPPMDESEMFS